MLPRDNIALLVEACTLLDYPGVAEIFPRHLILTGKLNAHRLAHCLRKYCRIVSDSVRAVQSIASGTAPEDDVHVLRLRSEDHRRRGLLVPHPLRWRIEGCFV